MIKIRRDIKKSLLGAIFILVLFLSFPILISAQSGSLYFSPSTSQVSVGQSFSTVLRVNTGGTAINVAEGSIVFDEGRLSVVSISKTGSVFSIWPTEPKFSNAEGTIEFAGGVPSPGYSGSSGLVMTITFKRLRLQGIAEINLVSGGILANDGLGTNILSGLGKASYNIGSSTISTPAPQIQGVSTTSTPSVFSSVPRVLITSTTHPDQNRWYSGKNPLFKWELPAGTTQVVLVLGTRPDSVPRVVYSPPIKEKTIADVADGVWYLNAQFRTASGLGLIESFKFSVDTKAPADFEITRSDINDPTNPRPELLFESSDKPSGIDRYEMKVGNGQWIIINPELAGQPYAMPLQRYGTNVVEVRAFDKAGNYSSAKTTIQIKAIKAPVITEIDQETKVGQALSIKGQSDLGQTIIVEAVPHNKAPEAYAGDRRLTFETAANDNGSWDTVLSSLDPGRYVVTAIAQDERGAISEPSNSVEVRVKGDFLEFISNAFDGSVGVLSNGGLLIAFLVAVIGLVLVLIELLRIKSKEWIQPITNWLFLKRVHKKSDKLIGHIVTDIDKEIKFLRQIARRRPLGPEENYLKSKLEQYRKTLKNISREGE